MSYTDLTLFPLIKSDASFSKDRIHRYTLYRVWNEELPKVLFIGLNPSTATETKNDPTIRRCMGYAKDWGYGSYIMGNIFAFRSTDPKNLRKTHDPIGSETDHSTDETTYYFLDPPSVLQWLIGILFSDGK